MTRAHLVLADGTHFEGIAIGAEGETVGEGVFTFVLLRWAGAVRRDSSAAIRAQGHNELAQRHSGVHRARPREREPTGSGQGHARRKGATEVARPKAAAVSCCSGFQCRR